MRKPGHGNNEWDRDIRVFIIVYYMLEYMEAEKLPTNQSTKKRAALKHELVWAIGGPGQRPGLFDVFPDLAVTCPYRACDAASANALIAVSSKTQSSYDCLDSNALLCRPFTA